ncbi:MAG: class I SAM-dependent methyltransferase [Xenococcaceae cyanobacterium MO_167.B27]|nr:class I SAM-dependent methyltransferase [Xenococcaceae cyanobacterium MO_167.B27]
MNDELVTARTRTKELADRFLQQNNPTGWFEVLYSQAKGDTSQIPWADLRVNPNLSEWLENNQIQAEGKKALVVGCGLGDDAEALSKQGFAVTGFDISASAIAWCKQRFPDSEVNYLVSDALKLEQSWQQSFDFILESYTLQSLPSSTRKQVIETIVEYLAPGGTLLIICRGRNKSEDQGKYPPYPLTKEELAFIETLGLTKVALEDYIDSQTPPVRRFRIKYLKE